MLAPQRPPAPPTEYFQFNLGGYDLDNLIAGNISPHLQGYVGCMRGLKIGDDLFDLSLQVTNSTETGTPINYSVHCDLLLDKVVYGMNTRLESVLCSESCINRECTI